MSFTTQVVRETGGRPIQGNHLIVNIAGFNSECRQTYIIMSCMSQLHYKEQF